MSDPEYFICLQCEAPTYQFDYSKDKLVAAVCTTCGADDVSDFMTQDEYDDEA